MYRYAIGLILIAASLAAGCAGRTEKKTPELPNDRFVAVYLAILELDSGTDPDLQTKRAEVYSRMGVSSAQVRQYLARLETLQDWMPVLEGIRDRLGVEPNGPGGSWQRPAGGTP